MTIFFSSSDYYSWRGMLILLIKLSVISKITLSPKFAFYYFQ